MEKTKIEELKEELSPEFDDLIKTLLFPDKFYSVLDRIINRERKELIEDEIKFLEWEIGEDDFSNMMKEVCLRRLDLIKQLKELESKTK